LGSNAGGGFECDGRRLTRRTIARISAAGRLRAAPRRDEAPHRRGDEQALGHERALGGGRLLEARAARELVRELLERVVELTRRRRAHRQVGEAEHPPRLPASWKLSLR
jgi:hypothetical protein